MRRVATVIGVREEKFAEYRALHADPRPGVLAALRRHGISNYSIFHRDGLLFAYFEYHGADYDADMAAIAADPVTRSWCELTDPCQQPVPTAAEGEWWTAMEQVFHMR